jgi:hypothetical protein
MSDDVQYESKTVKAIRGMEARAVAKWEADGWEFVGRTSGTVSTELSFRRVQRKLSRAVVAAAAGIGVLVVIGTTIGVLTERNDPTSAAPPVSVTTEPGGSESGTEAPTTEASSAAAASPSESAPSATLTRTNNREFAEVLKADYCDDRIDTFATKHEGQTVEFAGIILDLAPRGDTDTRYDILIAPGNTVEATEGPLFRYEDVNTTSDFGWAGSDLPDTVAKGSKLQLAAEVGDFDTDRCLLSMTPVATRSR